MRVTDDFMRAAHERREVADARRDDRRDARHARRRATLLREMADAAHVCGDPGIQYDTTINRWNPVKASGRINSSNPCSEYMFLDDTACNLASLNLMKFVDDGRAASTSRRSAARPRSRSSRRRSSSITRTTRRRAIARNSHLYRPLGLGYANLGALLMALGLPYDSDEGRNLAAAITVADVRPGLRARAPRSPRRWGRSRATA